MHRYSRIDTSCSSCFYIRSKSIEESLVPSRRVLALDQDGVVPETSGLFQRGVSIIELDKLLKCSNSTGIDL